MTDFDAVKKLATLPTRTVPLCLAGELVDEYERLERQLGEAKPATSVGDVSPRRAILEQMEDIRDQMRESTVDFRLQALGARPWALFYASQPTRETNEAGENVESDEDWEPRNFAWQAKMVSRSCVDPVMTVEQVEELVDLMPLLSWRKLVNSAFLMNMGEVDVPNFDAASEETQDSSPT
jgi:hypothetical protein